MLVVSDWGSGASRKVVGAYHQVGGKWCYVTNEGETNFLSTTILRMRMTSDDNSATKAFPRIFWKNWYFLIDQKK